MSPGAAVVADRSFLGRQVRKGAVKLQARQKDPSRLVFRKRDKTGGEAGEEAAEEVMDELRPRLEAKIREYIEEAQGMKDDSG